MASTYRVQDSRYYADHDDCVAHGGDQGYQGQRYIDGEEVPVWNCPCGGWFYIPSFEEVYDC